MIGRTMAPPSRSRVPRAALGQPGEDTASLTLSVQRAALGSGPHSCRSRPTACLRSFAPRPRWSSARSAGSTDVVGPTAARVRARCGAGGRLVWPGTGLRPRRPTIRWNGPPRSARRGAPDSLDRFRVQARSCLTHDAYDELDLTTGLGHTASWAASRPGEPSPQGCRTRRAVTCCGVVPARLPRLTVGIVLLDGPEPAHTPRGGARVSERLRQRRGGTGGGEPLKRAAGALGLWHLLDAAVSGDRHVSDAPAGRTRRHGRVAARHRGRAGARCPASCGRGSAGRRP